MLAGDVFGALNISHKCLKRKPSGTENKFNFEGKWLKFCQDWYISSSLSRLWKFFQSWIRNSSPTVLHFWRMHGTIKGGKSVQTFQNVIYHTLPFWNILTHPTIISHSKKCWLLVDGWIKRSGRWRRKAILGNYWTPKFRSGQRQETSSEYHGSSIPVIDKFH